MKIVDPDTGEDITEVISSDRKRQLEDVELVRLGHNPGKVSLEERKEILKNIEKKARQEGVKGIFS